jgi:hypothetical protein
MERERWSRHLRQYRLAAKIAAAPYSPDAYDEMLAFLLSRKALQEVPELREELRPLDEAFARALAGASARWRQEIREISEGAGFAEKDWWRSIVRLATPEPVALRRAG